MLVSFCLSPSTVALMMLMCRCCSDAVFIHFSVWNFWTSLLSVLNCWCLSPSTVALIVSPVPFLLSMYYATNTLHWRCSVVPTVGDIFLLLNLWRHITSRKRHVSSFKLFPYLGLEIDSLQKSLPSSLFCVWNCLFLSPPIVALMLSLCCCFQNVIWSDVWDNKYDQWIY